MSQTNFVKSVIAGLSKDDKAKMQERVVEFAENAAIDCEEQISIREADLKRVQGAVKKSESALTKAKANLEVVKNTIPSNNSFESYLTAWNNASEDISNAEENLQYAQNDVKSIEEEIATLRTILEHISK